MGCGKCENCENYANIVSNPFYNESVNNFQTMAQTDANYQRPTRMNEGKEYGLVAIGLVGAMALYLLLKKKKRRKR